MGTNVWNAINISGLDLQLESILDNKMYFPLLNLLFVGENIVLSEMPVPFSPCGKRQKVCNILYMNIPLSRAATRAERGGRN